MSNLCLSATLLCTLSLPCLAFSAVPGPRQAAALWLSRQLHRPLDASQVLVAPAVFEGCTITRARFAPIGATALSLRCPAQPLPQLVLLNLPVEPSSPRAASLPPKLPTDASHSAPSTPPLVRAGATLQADWRTAALHAELPVVALAPGAAGAEIRVRVAHGSRILRARIHSAHTVSVIVHGA